MLSERSKAYLEMVLVIVTLGVGASFYAHNLGHSYINPDDELVHVNVVKNLADKCCLPRLHLTDLGTDPRDWTNNYIWVHKPLVPFFVQAGAYKLFGSNLFAFRLPGLVFAVTTALVLFLIGKKRFGFGAGYCSLLLFLSNSYVFEQVQGRTFSGFSDLFMLLFLVGGLYFLLETQANPTVRNYVLFGLSIGLAFLGKSGLALPPFVALAVLTMGMRKYIEARRVAVSVLAFLIVAVPHEVLMAQRFPAEFGYEQSRHIAHLVENVEGWGRPPDYYFSLYLVTVLGPGLVPAGMFGWLFAWLRTSEASLRALSVWSASYLVPLTFGVSKIPNFILPVLPAMLLLGTATCFHLWREEKHRSLAAVAGSALAIYVAFHFNVIVLNPLEFFEDSLLIRFSVLIVGIISYAILYLSLGHIGRRSIKRLSLVLAISSLLLVVRNNGLNNLSASNRLPRDYEMQQRLMLDAEHLKTKLPRNSIVIVHIPSLQQGENSDPSRLYFAYWSGLDSLGVPDSARREKFNDRPVYWLSSTPQTDLVRVEMLSSADLYSE